METFVRDARYAARSLGRSPGLVVVVVLCLGLGIGVNTAMFSVFNATVLRGPSARQAGRLVQIEPGNGDQISYLNYRDLRQALLSGSGSGSRPAFSELAISGSTTLNLSAARTDEQLESLSGLQVSGNFFDLLGVSPVLGRTFSAEESVPERQPRVVILDHGFWRRRFQEDPAIIGRAMTLNGEAFTVIGVLGRNYRPGMGLFVPDVYVPISPIVSSGLQDRRRAAFDLRARLADGVSRVQAQAAFTNAARQLEAAFPEQNRSLGEPALVLSMTGLGSLQGRGVPSGVPMLIAAPFVVFGTLLLIACANVAGVLLARGASRRAEIAIRLALGASRSSLIRMLLTECLLLSSLATLGGIALTFIITPLFTQIHLPNALAFQLPPVTIDMNLALYAMAMALTTCLVCGLVPAWQATRVTLAPGLQDAIGLGRGRGLARAFRFGFGFGFGRARAGHGRSLRSLLIVAQVAASVLLLVTCLLFLRSMFRIATIDPGFDVHHGVTARVSLERNRFTPEQQHALAERIARRLESTPGVVSTSYSDLIPLGGDATGRRAQLRDRADDRGFRVLLNNVGPRYFETMQIPVRHGREFQPADRAGAPPVAIVNETFARLAGLDRSGDETAHTTPTRYVRILTGEPDGDPWREIVAVVADTKHNTLSEAPQPQVFLPYLQTGGRLVVQARIAPATSPSAAIAAVRAAIIDVDRTLQVNVQTTEQATSLEFTIRRFAAMLLGAMGGLGFLLAMIGVFGVLAWDVSRRASEIGIRMALGASRRAVRTRVVRDALMLVGSGTVVGLGAANVVTLPLRGFLAGVSASDPVTLIGVTAVLLSGAVLASVVPAHRASGIDPAIALRRD